MEDELAPDEIATPITQIISATLSTSMYTTLIIVVGHQYIEIDSWKKIGTYLLTFPQFIGFGLWMHDDNQSTRRQYLYSQYLAYYPLLVFGLLEFGNLLFNYLVGEASKKLLSVTAFSLTVFGILGMILLMSFQDYNYLETQLELGLDPFHEGIEVLESEEPEEFEEQSLEQSLEQSQEQSLQQVNDALSWSQLEDTPWCI